MSSLVEVKRVNILVSAANKYEEKFGDDIMTLIVGRQLEPENAKLQN